MIVSDFSHSTTCPLWLQPRTLRAEGGKFPLTVVNNYRCDAATIWEVQHQRHFAIFVASPPRHHSFTGTFLSIVRLMYDVTLTMMNQFFFDLVSYPDDQFMKTYFDNLLSDFLHFYFDRT